MKSEFYYPSKNGVTEIHALEWKPESEVKWILQISHGMVEYINRYDRFARFLCDKGVYVVGNDHLGHGKSVQAPSELGYFAPKGGNEILLEDMNTLRVKTMKKYPQVPYFLLGHSMGSTLARQYLLTQGRCLSGMILTGLVADRPDILLRTGQILCRVIGKLKGDHYRSKLVNNMAFGGYNKTYKKPKTRADWVTSDPQKLEEYINDPLCSFMFTVSAYDAVFEGVRLLKNKDDEKLLPKNVPILLSSGEQDPVGDFGRGVRKIWEDYYQSDMEDVRLKLYKGDRHEILNEVNYQEVYEDLAHWMEEIAKPFMRN